MAHDFDFQGSHKPPDGKPASGAYNPADYGLPVWRDEEHLPPEKKEASAPCADQPAEAPHGMSAEQAKQKLCLWAQEQIGYHEGDNNRNRYADTPGLTEMYGWYPQNQPWCDIFYDAGMISCFGLDAACAMTYQPKGAGSALCRQSAQYYKDHGAFFKTPEVGDQVFFYASGDINHTGIVVRVYGGSVVCVEGNSSDQVAERVYQVGDSKIAGYGRPNWSAWSGTNGYVPADAATGGDAVDKPSDGRRFYELRLPYLRRGDCGELVFAVQSLLIYAGYSCGPDGADGDFGANTEKAIQSFQRKLGLAADGVVGPETAAALFNADVVPTAEHNPPLQDAQDPKTDSVWDNLINRVRGKGGKKNECT